MAREREIAETQPSITVKELREVLEGLPDGLPVTVSDPRDDWWLNITGARIPEEPEADEPSLILFGADTFDPRQF